MGKVFPEICTNDTILINILFFGRCPASIHLLRVNNSNTGTRCEICSKLTIKIPKISNNKDGVVLVSLLLTLNIFHTFF